MTPIREAARNRWPNILPALGIDRKYLTKRQGPCPICKEGKDRFRFDDKGGEGTFYCNHCGAGDGVRLIELVSGLSFKEAVGAIEAVLGTAEPVKRAPACSEARKRQVMNDLWTAGVRLSDCPATQAWWFDRCGSIPAAPDLRAHRAMRHRDGGLHPGMLALIRDRDGRPASLHRTFMTDDGRKAPVDGVRMMLGGVPKGSAVRLGPHAEVLGIAEGLETANAASLLFEVPVWAALNADLLASWSPPSGVTKVMIFGDCDASYTGQAVAFALARRLTTAGLKVETHIPETPGTDWADVLLANPEARAA